MKLIALLVLLASSLASAQSIFGCQNEFCLFNITTQLWSCRYESCNKMPNLTIINQTNITVVVNQSTVINTTNVSINLTTISCNEAGITTSIQNLTGNLTSKLEEQFNLTGLYSDCRFSRETLKTEITQCTDNVENYRNNFIEKATAEQVINSCKANSTLLSSELTKTKDVLPQYAVGGFLAGLFILWWFKVRRPDIEAERTATMPSYSTRSIDTKTIEEDAKTIQEIYDKEDSVSKIKNKVSKIKDTFKKKREG